MAEETVRRTLEKHPDLKGILANNDAMTMAAIKVLKEKNLTDKIITVGADASKEACLAIARGEHDADVDKMPYVLGMVSFKVASSLAREEPWEYDREIKNGEYDVRVKVTPIMLIDKYNLITIRDRWPEFNQYIKTVHKKYHNYFSPGSIPGLQENNCDIKIAVSSILLPLIHLIHCHPFVFIKFNTIKPIII